MWGLPEGSPHKNLCSFGIIDATFFEIVAEKLGDGDDVVSLFVESLKNYFVNEQKCPLVVLNAFVKKPRRDLLCRHGAFPACDTARHRGKHVCMCFVI